MTGSRLIGNHTSIKQNNAAGTIHGGGHAEDVNELTGYDLLDEKYEKQMAELYPHLKDLNRPCMGKDTRVGGDDDVFLQLLVGRIRLLFVLGRGSKIEKEAFLRNRNAFSCKTNLWELCTPAVTRLDRP